MQAMTTCKALFQKINKVCFQKLDYFSTKVVVYFKTCTMDRIRELSDRKKEFLEEIQQINEQIAVRFITR